MITFPEQFRIRRGHMASTPGGNGAFMVRLPNGSTCAVIASTGEGWEHVSVSLQHRVPIWDEMCSIKRLFWEPEDCVVQYHPPKSQYVNCHPNCLHLWRPLDAPLPTPPTWMVGLI